MYINFVNDQNKNIYISSWLLLITFLVGLMIVVGGLTRYLVELARVRSLLDAR